MPEVKIYQLLGKTAGPGGRILTIKWPDIEVLHLNGREIAKIKTKPGAEIGLHSGVLLTPAEKSAIEKAVAAARGGVKPSRIIGPAELPYEIIDDDTDWGSETNLADAEDE